MFPFVHRVRAPYTGPTLTVVAQASAQVSDSSVVRSAETIATLLSLDHDRSPGVHCAGIPPRVDTRN